MRRQEIVVRRICKSLISIFYNITIYVQFCKPSGVMQFYEKIYIYMYVGGKYETF